MIFLLQGSLGDQITMLPAIIAKRTMYGELDHRDTYVVADPRVFELFPQYEWLKGRCDPAVGVSEEFEYHVVQLNVWSAVKRFGKAMHPTRMFFAELGLPVPPEPVRPEIVVDESAPAYDYVIAPFANDQARAMLHGYPKNTLKQILVKLGAIDIHHVSSRSNSVAVCCGKGEAPTWLSGFSCSVIEGKPLPYVAGLMRNARKAVITVDSMANRLAHAAGIDNHVLLCSDVVPLEWATHPKARVLYGPPESWTVEKILEMLPA